MTLLFEALRDENNIELDAFFTKVGDLVRKYKPSIWTCDVERGRADAISAYFEAERNSDTHREAILGLVDTANKHFSQAITSDGRDTLIGVAGYSEHPISDGATVRFQTVQHLFYCHVVSRSAAVRKGIREYIRGLTNLERDINHYVNRSCGLNDRTFNIISITGSLRGDIQSMYFIWDVELAVVR